MRTIRYTSDNEKSPMWWSLFVIVFVLFSCSDDGPSPEASFFKIYDDSDADLRYRPIDIIETIDGFILLTGVELSQSDFMGVQLIKVDSEGNYESDRTLNNYVVPIGHMYLNPADSNSYFFAMDPTSLQAVLIGVNPQLEVETEALIGGINYPLSSKPISNGNLLLQSYDPLSQEIEISEITLDGNYQNGSRYSIGPGDDVVEDIVNHYLNASERPLPFFCGELSAGNYYYNGFYNYSFSLVFTDFSAAPSGVLQGQSTNAGIRALMPLEGNAFALAGFQFDANYQLASANLDPSNTTASSVDLFPGNMAEIKPYSPSAIINYSNGSDYTVFATETKGREILLNFYDNSGTIRGSHRIGHLNPFTFSSLKTGNDGSLLVVGTTFVAGRFERIAFKKIAASQVNAFIK